MKPQELLDRYVSMKRFARENWALKREVRGKEFPTAPPMPAESRELDRFLAKQRVTSGEEGRADIREAELSWTLECKADGYAATVYSQGLWYRLVDEQESKCYEIPCDAEPGDDAD